MPTKPINTDEVRDAWRGQYGSGRIDSLCDEVDRLRTQVYTLRESLHRVDRLIVCANVRMDKGPRWRFQTTGQHEAAEVVKAALDATREYDDAK